MGWDKGKEKKTKKKNERPPKVREEKGRFVVKFLKTSGPATQIFSL